MTEVLGFELIGRARELALISGCLAAMRAGEGASLMLSGEPGQGKTSLLDAARANAGDALVLACRGVEWEAELPFSGLHELLGPLLGDLEPLPEQQRSALEAAFGWDPGAPAAGLNVYAGALSLVLEATRRQPVLLIVDDLQWVDAPTVQALSFIARRSRGERIALVVASRPGPELPGLPREPVVLEGLPADAVAALAQREFGRSLPAAALEDLARASAGNPLAVTESLRQFGDALGLRGTMLDDPLPVGALIERAFSERLSALSPDGRRAAEVLAASVSDGAAIGLAAVAEAGLAPSSVAELEDAGIVAFEADRFRFAHPVLRSLVHATSSASGLRAAHTAFAAVTDDRALRAWHAAMATLGPDAAAADELDAVAGDFVQRGGGLAAAQALVRAAALTADGDARSDRLLRAARAAHLAGRSEWGAELCARAEREAVSSRAQLRARYGATSIDAHAPAGPGFVARYLAIAEEVAADDPDTATQALVSAVIESMIEGETTARGTALEHLEALSGSGGLAAVSASDADFAIGSVQLATGCIVPSTSERLRRAGELRLAMLREPSMPPVDIAFLQALLSDEQFELADALIEAMLERSRRRQELPVVSGTMSARVLLDLRFSRFRTARTTTSEMVDGPSERLAFYTPMWWLLHAWAGAVLGEGESESERDAMITWARRSNDMVVELEGCAIAGGLRHLARGDAEQALAALEPAREWADDNGLWRSTFAAWPVDLAEAYAITGQREAAEREAAMLRKVVRASGNTWMKAGLLRVEARLAPVAALDCAFAEAAAAAETARSPFDHARTLLAHGERLRDAGIDDATPVLQRALAMFDELGARPWAERTRLMLGIPAAAPKSRAERDRDDLTPQERQVAELVAAGASNKEAAGELFLSPKTIEAHLSRIYRKLGVSSRTQLAARFARADEEERGASRAASRARPSG